MTLLFFLEMPQMGSVMTVQELENQPMSAE
jgi:hypothetical protein